MTADAGLVLDRGQPIGLREFVGNVALAVELIRGRDLQHREPINRRIILRRGCVVGRRHGGEVQTLARLAVDLGGIDQAIAAHPYFILGFRQVRQHVAALVVGHHHLGKTGAQLVGLRDHPDAGFGAVRAFDDATDRFAVDRDILRAQAHGCRDEERRHRNRRHAAKQCSLHADLPEESVRRDWASPMHVVIWRDFAPGATHPQGDSAAALPPCGQIICGQVICIQFDVLAALLSFSNRPARSLRTVANFEKWSVTTDTRSSSSRFASVKVFTRSARSPPPPASRRAMRKASLSRMSCTWAMRLSTPPSPASSGASRDCSSASFVFNWPNTARRSSMSLSSSCVVATNVETSLMRASISALPSASGEIMPSAFSSFSISPSMSSCSTASLENCVFSCATPSSSRALSSTNPFTRSASGPCGVRWSVSMSAASTSRASLNSLTLSVTPPFAAANGASRACNSA